MSESTLPFLKTLYTLRWVAVIGQVATVWIVIGPLDIDIPALPLWAGIGALALFNVFARWRTRHAAAATAAEAFGHTVIDVAALAWLVGWSGGLANPFASLLLLPIALSAVALSRRWVVATAVTGLLGYAAIAVFGRDLPHVHGGPAAGFNLHLWGMAANFLVSVAVVLYFSTRLVSLLRQRERELAALRERFVRNEGIVALATHAASVAHELNTPLGTLTLIADDLLDQSLPPELHEDVATMRGLVDVCRERVRELAMPADRALATGLDLERVIARWQLVRPDIALVRTGEVPPTLPTDPAIGHLLQALLNNAADAGVAAGNPRVDLELQADECQLQGRIRDHGAGFDPSRPFLPELFRSGKPDGLGVGLALSHATIEQLGGELWMEGAGEQGTRVCFRIPLQAMRQRSPG